VSCAGSHDHYTCSFPDIVHRIGLSPIDELNKPRPNDVDELAARGVLIWRLTVELRRGQHARGIAQMMRVGLFKPVHVKTLVAQEQRSC